MNISKGTALLNMKIYQLAVDGVINHQDISEDVAKYYGNGTSLYQSQFGKTFAKSCADQAFRLLEEHNNSITDAAFHLSRCTQILNNSEFMYGIMHFQQKLISHFPEFAHDNSTLRLDVALQIEHGIERSENKTPIMKIS